MGSRYGGMKQLDHIGPSGETIMDYSIYDALQAGFGKVVFVIRKSFEDDFRSTVLEKIQGRIPTALSFQELGALPQGYSCPKDRIKPWGTGHAIWVARNNISEPFAVINADDFYSRDAFVAMAAHLGHTEAMKSGRYAMCGYRLENTLSEHGQVSRGICTVSEDGMLSGVDEVHGIEKNSSGAIISTGSNAVIQPEQVVSMNFWGFSPDIFQHLGTKLEAFLKSNRENPKTEFYIPVVVDELIGEGQAMVKVLPSQAKWFGVTYREDKSMAVNAVQHLVKAGTYPDNLWNTPM